MKLSLCLLVTALVLTSAQESPTPPPIDCSMLINCSTEQAEPVCASDGLTYRNECAFQSAYCVEPNDAFFVVTEGPCPDDAATYVVDDVVDPQPAVIAMPTEVEGEAEARVLETFEFVTFSEPERISTPSPAPLASNPYCTLECSNDVKPICGSDGFTSTSYINDCYLLAAKCTQPSIDKLHDGLCIVQPPPVKAVETHFSTLEVTRPKCNAFCDRVYEPVCGSNGITYANHCLLDYATCQNPRVKLLGEGKCADLLGSAPGPSTSSVCVPVPCSVVDAPICGSDGNTYMNLCLLTNAQCDNSKLLVLHEGECGADTILTCASLTCPQYTECREEEDTGVAYCADVCAPERCSQYEECKLYDAECFTAPCSPVATCVPLA
ncbi:hypothetical protein Poli38472_006998 [Pythium oligandrum]|uniref:Kazal-like domain-containing protein n=1 Tax=Pythium oligandrum TaxID=41045 RepID=A0A8K1C9X6_PYTOL|nr:hypothetical protein Poli38472_006998 [Pythium oligandrum]|eukprot:TMW58853.1 hypothetical protein Poli38472_006998 [Pythium oligandrum]